MRKVWQIVNEYLMQISQVLFFRNSLFGIIFLLLTAIMGTNVFLCGVFASLVGFFYSKAYLTPKLIRDGGLMTINGFFFGNAIASLFQEGPQMYACLIIGALAIPVVTKATFEVLQHWKLSPYIFAYILIVWVFYIGAPVLSLPFAQTLSNSYLAHQLQIDFMPKSVIFSVLLSSFASIGHLFYISNPVFGLAIVLLILVFSLRKGLYFLMGSVAAGMGTLLIPLGSAAGLDAIAYTYCAGLVGLGLASFPERFSLKTILLFCLFSFFITLALSQLFAKLNIPILNLPYVITLWIAILSRVPRLNVSWAQ